jgi:FixJ family two-component response regulator
MTFLRRFSTECKHPVGVIVSTGFPSPEGREEFEQAGTPRMLPLDYIGKPFEMDDILKSIANALERIHAERAALPKA